MTDIKYVDTHCHIQFDQYASDSAELIEEMRKKEVAGIVVGIDSSSSEKAVSLASENEHLYASVGLHPNYITDIVNQSSNYELTMSKIRKLAESAKVVAIGECGLDYFRPIKVDNDVKNKQKEVLRAHMELSAELGLPLIIHARPSKGTMDAYHDLIEILETMKAIYGSALRGNVHFFVGGTTEMRALIELEFTVSFTAVITFARDYDDVIKAAPLTSILSETDAPYVAPAYRRGRRNDPISVIDVVAKIAEIRDESVENVRSTLFANARRVFNLKN